MDEGMRVIILGRTARACLGKGEDEIPEFLPAEGDILGIGNEKAPLVGPPEGTPSFGVSRVDEGDEVKIAVVIIVILGKVMPGEGT